MSEREEREREKKERIPINFTVLYNFFASFLPVQSFKKLEMKFIGPEQFIAYNYYANILFCLHVETSRPESFINLFTTLYFRK